MTDLLIRLAVSENSSIDDDSHANKGRDPAIHCDLTDGCPYSS